MVGVWIVDDNRLLVMRVQKTRSHFLNNKAIYEWKPLGLKIALRSEAMYDVIVYTSSTDDNVAVRASSPLPSPMSSPLSHPDLIPFHYPNHSTTGSTTDQTIPQAAAQSAPIYSPLCDHYTNLIDSTHDGVDPFSDGTKQAAATSPSTRQI